MHLNCITLNFYFYKLESTRIFAGELILYEDRIGDNNSVFEIKLYNLILNK